MTPTVKELKHRHRCAVAVAETSQAPAEADYRTFHRGRAAGIREALEVLGEARPTPRIARAKHCRVRAAELIVTSK